MVDVMTLIMILLITLGLIITNIYILIYFSHPDDKDSILGYILKGIVIIGLTLAWCQVLMIPLDVSNNRTFGGGINMKTFWLIIFVITIIYILIIFPISSSLYDCQDEWTPCEKIRHCLCFFLAIIIFFIAITAILYSSIGKTDIPISVIKCHNTPILSSVAPVAPHLICIPDKKTKSIELKVNIIIYSVAVLTFVSWIIFCLFGGIGLSSVPMDFFISFCNRPKNISSEEINERKKNLLKEIEEIKLLGDEVDELEKAGVQKKFFFTSSKRKYNRIKNEFVSRFALAQKELEIVNKDKINDLAVVFYYLLIPLGILTSILTILWIIQFICSYFYILKDGRPGYPFLSYLLIFFQDHDVSFLSFAIFSLLTLYLLFCVIKGNFKFGVRILCCWSVHPMKKGKTYMNSFLFNISLILLGSMAITQFVSDCLSDYVAFTDVDALFNSIIKNLRFFKYFYRYHIFQYILFVVFVLSLIYLICRPVDKPIDLSKGKKDFSQGKKKDIINKKKAKNDDKDTEDGGSQDKKLVNKNKADNKGSVEEKEEKLDADEDIDNMDNIINSNDSDMK
jgi:LMBR1 domain-containing protein 1